MVAHLREAIGDRPVHVGGNALTIAIGVKTHPPLFGLTEITRTHARKQREIALVFVAVGRLPPRRDVGRDVEQERDVRLRQESLNLLKPVAVEALRLAIRDARREIPIADENRAALALVDDPPLPLVAIGDVEK